MYYLNKITPFVCGVLLALTIGVFTVAAYVTASDDGPSEADIRRGCVSAEMVARDSRLVSAMGPGAQADWLTFVGVHGRQCEEWGYDI